MQTARFLPLVLLAAAVALTPACTWVKVSPEAQQVVVLPASRVGACTRIGVISTTVKAVVMGIPRDATKVRNELDDLARQQAVSLGANTVVRQSVVNGKGSYAAYNCP